VFPLIDTRHANGLIAAHHTHVHEEPIGILKSVASSRTIAKARSGFCFFF